MAETVSKVLYQLLPRPLWMTDVPFAGGVFRVYNDWIIEYCAAAQIGSSGSAIYRASTFPTR
jgi:hypothetical protein